MSKSLSSPQAARLMGRVPLPLDDEFGQRAAVANSWQHSPFLQRKKKVAIFIYLRADLTPAGQEGGYAIGRHE
jgi:hypothetical protein